MWFFFILYLIAGNAGSTMVNASFHGEEKENVILEDTHDKDINIVLEVKYHLI